MGRIVRYGCLLLALAACAPVQETVYRFEPPAEATAETRQCLADCEVARDACLAAARAEFQSCEESATLRQTACARNAQLDYMTCIRIDDDDRGCYRRFCRRALCPTTGLDACASAYRRCFSACGGSVVEEERCVANCPS